MSGLYQRRRTTYEYSWERYAFDVCSTWSDRRGGHMFITEYEFIVHPCKDYVFIRKFRSAKRTARKRHLAALRRYNNAD